MNEIILPAIGTGGFFELKEPYSSLIKSRENYVCKAIRTISDYIGNNEDPFGTIYQPYGLTDEVYQEAVKNDMEIICLQNSLGHWLYIPANYIKKFPDINGKKYRMISVVVNMPALPIESDYSFILNKFKDIVKDKFGIDSNAKLVETSKPILVPIEKHREREIKRKLASNGNMSDALKIANLEKNYQLAIDKIAELEAYILSKE